MLMKIVIGIVTGTLIIGGCTFKKATDLKEYEIQRTEKIEQQLYEYLN